MVLPHRLAPTFGRDPLLTSARQMRGVRPPSCRIVCHLNKRAVSGIARRSSGATDEADRCGSYPRCGCGGLSYAGQARPGAAQGGPSPHVFPTDQRRQKRGITLSVSSIPARAARLRVRPRVTMRVVSGRVLGRSPAELTCSARSAAPCERRPRSGLIAVRSNWPLTVQIWAAGAHESGACRFAPCWSAPASAAQTAASPP